MQEWLLEEDARHRYNGKVRVRSRFNTKKSIQLSRGETEAYCAHALMPGNSLLQNQDLRIEFISTFSIPKPLPCTQSWLTTHE